VNVKAISTKYKKIVLYFCVLTVFTGCSSERSGNADITIDGFAGLAPLMEKWAEEFHAISEDVSFDVHLNGHENGFANLMSGTANMFVSNLNLTHAELGLVKSRGKIITKKIIAKDGVVIIVKGNSMVEFLRPEQIKSVFSGEITSWEDISGFDRPITVFYNKKDMSRNYFFCKRLLNGEEITGTAIGLDNDQEVIKAVSTTNDAIGISGLVAGLQAMSKVKPISIVDVEENKLVPPTLPYIQYNLYPLSRSVYVYYCGELTGAESSFIKYCLSKEGQKQMLNCGVLPAGA